MIGREFPLAPVVRRMPDVGALDDLLRDLSGLEFVYERVETEGSVYVFRHALTQETAYGACLSGIAASITAPSGTRSRSFTRAASRRSRNCWRSIRPQRRSGEIGRLRDPGRREIAAPLGQQRGAELFRRRAPPSRLLPDTEANRLRRIDAVIKQAEVKFSLGRHAEHIQALEQIAGSSKKPKIRVAAPLGIIGSAFCRA